MNGQGSPILLWSVNGFDGHPNIGRVGRISGTRKWVVHPNYIVIYDKDEFALRIINILQSPYLAIANKQAQIMTKAAVEMGFTPASRSRITQPTDTQLDLDP